MIMWKLLYVFANGSEIMGWRYLDIESATKVATDALTSGANTGLIGFKVIKEVISE